MPQWELEDVTFRAEVCVELADGASIEEALERIAETVHRFEQEEGLFQGLDTLLDDGFVNVDGDLSGEGSQDEDRIEASVRELMAAVREVDSVDIERIDARVRRLTEEFWDLEEET